MNLTLRQIERIDQITYDAQRQRSAALSRMMRRAHKPDRTPLQKWVRFQVFMVASFLALILCAFIAMNLGWSPGNQDQIAAEFRAYKAVRHDAMEVKW